MSRAKFFMIWGVALAFELACSSGGSLPTPAGDPSEGGAVDQGGSAGRTATTEEAGTAAEAGTAGACDDGTCPGAGACGANDLSMLDDGNPCTTDACNAASGVSHKVVPDGTSCADSNVCNGAEACKKGICASGSVPALDDENPCTVDTCDPMLGVQHAIVSQGTNCGVDQGCGGPAQCDATGECMKAGDDGNPCTVDECNPATGIVSHLPSPEGTACRALDSCYRPGTCDALSRCNPGAPVAKDDGDPCTLDTCEAPSGFKRRLCAPLDPTVSTVPGDANAWLYSGADPVQTGVAPGIIKRARASLLKGRILSRNGTPLSGAVVAIADHPEFGASVSQTNGEFEMVVNGGGSMTFRVQRKGFLTSDRSVNVPWANYAEISDITLIQSDAMVTPVDLTVSTSDFAVVRGLKVQDSDGARQPTILVPAGTTATMLAADGSTMALDALHIRVTEFTVGPDGPSMMPATLPATTAYTHAFEINADEAISAGATSIQFSKPLVYYVDNFLKFPTGTVVPLGSYDRQKHAWKIEKSGSVVAVVAIVNGVAQLNINTDPAAETPAQLAAAGITPAEQTQLAKIYSAGQSFWRVELPHFTSPYDTNWARYQPNASPPQPPQNRDDNDNITYNNVINQCEQAGGSSVECQNQTVHEKVPVAGTPLELTYSSERAPGRKGKYTTFIPISGDAVSVTPIPLIRIDLDVEVGGQSFHKSFPPQPNQTYSFHWDGRDNFGRQVQGVQLATITVSYIYPTHYAGGTLLFEDFVPGSGIVGIAPTRTEVPVSRTWTKAIGQWDQSRSPRLGGWTLSVHHDYDLPDHILSMGTGDSVRADVLPAVLANPGVGATLCSRAGRHRVRCNANDDQQG